MTNRQQKAAAWWYTQQQEPNNPYSSCNLLSQVFVGKCLNSSLSKRYALQRRFIQSFKTAEKIKVQSYWNITRIAQYFIMEHILTNKWEHCNGQKSCKHSVFVKNVVVVHAITFFRGCRLLYYTAIQNKNKENLYNITYEGSESK